MFIVKMLNPLQQNLKLIVRLEKNHLLRCLLSGIALLFLIWLFILIQLEPSTSFSRELYYWAGVTLTTPILYFTFVPFLRSLYVEGTARFPIDISLFTALTIGYFYSLWATLSFSEATYAYFDVILVILFFIYSCRYTEMLCRRRLAKKILGLSTLPSQEVKIVKADNQFHTCALQDIVLGDKLYVAPGEYFPVDGIISDHDTSVNESMLTGEINASPRFANDKIRAGTCNLDKGVIIQATSIFSDSYFGKILSSTQAVQSKKSPDLPVGDNLALWHLMIGLTLIAAIYCWWLPYNSEFALFCANSAFLITCPLAFAMISPLMTALILEIGAKKGILIKNPQAFLTLPQAQYVLFDKTGTLTEGNLAVEQVAYFNEAQAEVVLPLIAAVELNTHHPIAAAIVKYTQENFQHLPKIDITRLTVFPGSGLRALVDGKFVLIGSARWLRKNGIFVPADLLEEQENPLYADRIFVHCAIGGLEVARIELKDKIRPHTYEVIQYLKARHIHVSVLSGDRPAIVNAIAKQLGPIAATAQVLPQEKEAQIALLQDQGYLTVMVGDGLNDTLALKRADVGIAIGTDNPIAILCADIILPKPNLALIQEAFQISIFARKILHQNTVGALLFNGAMLPFAAVGKLNPSVMLMSLICSAVLIVANTARLKLLIIAK